MTPQQTQAMRQALEALKKYHYYTIDAGLPNQSMLNEGFDAITALNAVLADNALDKKAENARELGLDYELVRKSGYDYRIKYDGPCYKCRSNFCPGSCKEQPNHIGDANKMVEQPTVKQSLTVEQREPVAYGATHKQPITGALYKRMDGIWYVWSLIEDEPRKWIKSVGTAESCLVSLQPAQQEPFGYFRPEPFGWTDCAETDEGAVALYDRPQSMTPLTDEQIDVVTQKWAGLVEVPKARLVMCRGFARAIEAAHGITGEKK